MDSIAPLSSPTPTAPVPAPATAVATTPTHPAPAAPRLPNPAMRLDPALGIVVLEFRDRQGAPRTIPNERELRAYRTAAQTSTPDTAPAPPAADATPRAVAQTSSPGNRAAAPPPPSADAAAST